jgi:hypothetical protein
LCRQIPSLGKADKSALILQSKLWILPYVHLGFSMDDGGGRLQSIVFFPAPKYDFICNEKAACGVVIMESLIVKQGDSN